MSKLARMVEGDPFVAYSYAYPHKTAYRRFARPLPLEDLWAVERRDALFLYVHVPFCEYRCGFCNLFTTANPAEDVVARYLEAVRREATVVRATLGEARFARLALGGGTPTFLDVEELAEVFGIVTRVMGARPREVPVSVEASPATVDAEKLGLLREFGVDRLSLGVQTFDEREAGALGRPQRHRDVVRALDRAREFGFPTLNVDLIYGGAGQSLASWLATVREALAWRPEEIYLYPLYVRPLTGLGQQERSWEDGRLESYRQGRALLLDAGYRQVSLRMFRTPHATDEAGPVYCCQEDGMVGLGCGARSYTREVHYSTEYAVGRAGVLSILNDYIARDAHDFGAARYGFQLNGEEQRRRYVIMSLLNGEGLSRGQYAARFGRDPLEDLPQLEELTEHSLANVSPERLVLTPAGMERSDTIGPWLYSRKVRRRMEGYQAW